MRRYSIGFGTHSGTVAAASDWDGPMEVKNVRPALPESYERLCHETGAPQFLLPLRSPMPPLSSTALTKPRLERAIGVIYRPETELAEPLFPGRPAASSSTNTSGSTRPGP